MREFKIYQCEGETLFQLSAAIHKTISYAKREYGKIKIESCSMIKLNLYEALLIISYKEKSKDTQ